VPLWFISVPSQPVDGFHHDGMDSSRFRCGIMSRIS
jgi:hypothetical protein